MAMGAYRKFAASTLVNSPASLKRHEMDRTRETVTRNSLLVQLNRRCTAKPPCGIVPGMRLLRLAAVMFAALQ